MIKTLYRISDGGYKKDKLEFADKFYCLENFLKHFDAKSTVFFADNCKPETLQKLKQYQDLTIIESNKGSSAQSFRMVAQYALDNFTDETIVYFLEDDYLHKTGAAKAIQEGLTIGDYVTLYDHPDKYINKIDGGNPLVANGGELSRVLLTNSSHWKQTNSTTLTFACKMKTFKQDWPVFEKYSRGTLPNDDLIFYKLQSLKKLKFKLFGLNRKLVSPIPGFSTHIEKKWLSPLIDWNKE